MTTGKAPQAIVLTPPFEDALALFYHKSVNPDRFAFVMRAKGWPFYEFMKRQFTEGSVEAATTAALLYDKVCVHPATLNLDHVASPGVPIPVEADARIFFSWPKIIGWQYASLEATAHEEDWTDMQIQFALEHYGEDRGFVHDRLNWPLIEAAALRSPILVSTDYWSLYKLKLSRAGETETALPEPSEGPVSVAHRLNDALGATFSIKTWDDLLRLRRDRDIERYREKIFRCHRALISGKSIESIISEAEATARALEQIPEFTRRSRRWTFLTPSAILADVLLGAPIVSPVVGGMAMWNEARAVAAESKCRWMSILSRA